jgi:hypothetical protein
MPSGTAPNWLQRKLAIRGYKSRLAGRLRREYGVQDTYLPEQVEYCARHEFAVRRFGEVDWFAPQHMGYAFAMFCDRAAVEASRPDLFPDNRWNELREEVDAAGHANDPDSAMKHASLNGDFENTSNQAAADTTQDMGSAHE